MSNEAKALADEARALLRERGVTARTREITQDDAAFDRGLWEEMGRLGWLGVTIAEEFGGSDAGSEALCLLASELGRANAAVPFSSTVYFSADAIARLGSKAQKAEYLPAIAEGALIATVAAAEGFGDPRVASGACRVRSGRLSGAKWPVADGLIAGAAVVFAVDEDAAGEQGAFFVRLNDEGVQRRRLEGIDPSKELAALEFTDVPAQRLGDGPHGRQVLAQVFARAAVPMAFEQIGGAQNCLDMAVDYAKTRYAFGQPIGALQAIKHKLADVYIAVELARSNGYYAAWAHASGPEELFIAAATAHISATEAFFHAAKENIQTHGGIGVTADVDCHLYLRRCRHVAAQLGTAQEWKARLIAELVKRPEHWKD
jgi:acyl-CoA dehydrogenase